MDQLRAILEEALSGRGRMVTLVGEPGIGKTRTAQELGTYAVLRRCQVLWGRCYEGTGAPPYWPWVQAIRQYVRDRDPDQLRREMGSSASVIAEVVADVKDRLPGLTPPAPLDGPDSTRFRLFDSIATFLRSAAASQALVLVLDDLHWADKPSLLLLEFLAREIGNARIFLVGMYRDVDLNRRHPLALTLGELTKERLFERVLLRGLRRQDVERFIELAAGLKPQDGLTDAVFTQTEGNPLFVTEVVRLLVQEGHLTAENRGSLGERATRGRGKTTTWLVRVPQGVREVIGRRLDRLSERCNEVLTIAAVMGRQFSLDPLLAVVNDPSVPADQRTPDDRLFQILEEALSARVIEELSGAVGRYQFTHALIQETLFNELSTTHRVRLHARIAGSLDGHYGDRATENAAELAYHFAESETIHGPARLIKYSLIAGERALAASAYEAALDHFERVLAHEPADDVRTRVLRQRARLRLALFDGKGAAADYERLLEDATKNDDRRLQLDSLIGLAAAHYVISLDDATSAIKSRELFEEAYDLAQGLGDKAAMARSLLATQYLDDFWPDYLDRVRANVKEARGLAEELGDEDIVIEATRASLRFMSGQDAKATAEDLLTRLEARHDLLRLKELRFQMMWLYYGNGEFEKCIASCDAGIELASRIGTKPVQYPTIKALALLDLGQYGDAWASLQQEVAGKLYPFGRAHKSMGVGAYLVEIMDFEVGVKTLREVVASARELKRAWMGRVTLSLLAKSLIALRSLDEREMEWINQELRAFGVDLSPEAHAEISLYNGRIDEALELASDAATRALRGRTDSEGGRTVGFRAYAPLLEIRMRALLRLDRPQEALELSEEALEVTRQLRYRRMLWQIHGSRARAQELLGNSEAAAEERREAAAMVRSLAESIPDAKQRERFTSRAMERVLAGRGILRA